MVQRKVCLVGSFAVGITSLLQRFVYSRFSDKYLTTVGVKIDRKIVPTSQGSVSLILWDLAGEDEFQSLQTSFLRGAAGFVVVIDSTRNETLQQARSHLDYLEEEYPKAAKVIFANKADLENSWDLETDELNRLETRFAVFRTSAKTGHSVEEAFHVLADKMS
ncbi:MAG: GTP-binding protein [Verrucomicrobiaceae bacterium]|nr:GTP-binding protein [Verrucomicrobiaceae bacterium]NCF91586.1 GTP-binding protein [Verrucomicrobiaceae bacterium]